MITGSVEIKLDLFEAIASRSDRALDEILAEVGADGVEETKRNSRVKTGYLKSRNQLIRHGLHNYIMVNDASYAGYLNFGTKRIPADHFFDRGVQVAMKSVLDKAREFESRLG